MNGGEWKYEELWFGTTEGNWPVECFITESAAQYWLSGVDTVDQARRRLWKGRVSRVQELELIQPKAFLQPASWNQVAPEPEKSP